MMDALQSALLKEGKLLPLMELFYTLQGEGFHTGEAAVFIRIGGCDVGCKWCDAKESWNPSIHPLTTIEEILSQATAFPSANVVITGGEPLSYNLDPLCQALKGAGLKTFLETSGSEPLSGSWDWICLSPKTNALPLPALFPLAHELKVIIETPEDFDSAESYAEQLAADCLLFLQPEWSRRNTITPIIVDYIGSNPKWKLSLQMHKYIGIP
jgi:7-carboxy-7-deazaguanine synthase